MQLHAQCSFFTTFTLTAVFLGLLSSSLVAHGSNTPDNDGGPVLPSTDLCQADDVNRTNCQRAWFFPDVRINLVCRYDFRKSFDATETPYFWPTAASDTIQATWGPFLDYLVGLVPELGPDALLANGTGVGSFWMQGGEGRPGWEIPPCGTNRTQAVVHFPFLAVLLNESTTDPDLYNAGLPYATVNQYITATTLEEGLTQYLCSDLERLTLGIANGMNNLKNHPEFYGDPEEICPRVSSDDDGLWGDWPGYVLLAVGVFAVAGFIGLSVYCVRRHGCAGGDGDGKEQREETVASNV